MVPSQIAFLPRDRKVTIGPKSAQATCVPVHKPVNTSEKDSLMDCLSWLVLRPLEVPSAYWLTWQKGSYHSFPNDGAMIDRGFPGALCILLRIQGANI